MKYSSHSSEGSSWKFSEFIKVPVCSDFGKFITVNWIGNQLVNHVFFKYPEAVGQEYAEA